MINTVCEGPVLLEALRTCMAQPLDFGGLGPDDLAANLPGRQQATICASAAASLNYS